MISDNARKRLQGDSAALEELRRREQRQQAEDLAAETARLRKEHAAEVQGGTTCLTLLI